MKASDKNMTVYVPMCADIVHPGHLNIIRKAAELGNVTIGLLTDRAVADKKRLPLMTYAQRSEVIASIRGVANVMPQTSSDYRPNLQKLKPAYVVHGDDWSLRAKQQVLDALKEWGGRLVEVPYTPDISSTSLHEQIKSRGISVSTRLERLHRLIEVKRTVTALEAHNGITGLIVENTRIKNAAGHWKEFDAIWISSLTDSFAKGKPDTEAVDRSSRVTTVNEVLEVTTKPLIVDVDTGGHSKHFAQTVRTFERLGVSAVVIEDKTGPKYNSLHSDTQKHTPENIDVFATKIKAGVDAKNNEKFMIIARIESLILGLGQADALNRAKAYIKAGASAIMIHSKDETGMDVKLFCQAYRKLENHRPLMVVPTSYSSIDQKELASWGADIVVYANHLLRAAYPVMKRSAEMILQDEKTENLEKDIMPIHEFLKVVSEEQCER